MASGADIRLVLNHLNVANQIDERLNEKREDWEVNTTQMLVLAELQAVADRFRKAPARAAMSASELAMRLQQSRATISIQLKGLRTARLIEEVAPTSDEDRRSRRYRLTQLGADRARAVRELLAQLSELLHVVLGHVLGREYHKALAQLADELPDAPAATQVTSFRAEKIRKRRRATLAQR
jgi:DNA-binding MarR family transcriptional regulator